MATEDIKRKLTAIFSADVEGYSRLMGDNELATVQTLTSYKETMRKLIKHYRGRVVDSTGDNLLAEFVSVVDAVQCAVEVQHILNSKNESLLENRRMLFRIGINLGDVIEEDDRIFGDGVNIAARVESLSEGGGVCISGSAYEQIENKLALGYEYMGEHTVKNIAKPIKVYKVPMGPVEVKKKVAVRGWRKVAIAAVAILILAGVAGIIWHYHFRLPPIEAASVEKMAYPLPDKPSIAVLPFDNLSGDPGQNYIVDGITDAIITGLSKTPEMFVIARNSVLTYKGKPTKVKQVSEELGVRYVLEGSVQKQGDRLRINAQLIDAIKGHHLWAEKYDRDLKDIFALQDEITMKIIESLQLKLTEGEYARVLAKGTENIEAYSKCLQAIQIFRRLTKEDILKSRKMFEEVISLDPKYPMPYIYLGWTHLVNVRHGWSKSPKESLARAEELARKALELDDSLGILHRILSDIYRRKRQWDKAFEEAERAVSINPTAMNMYGLAMYQTLAGRPEEAIVWYEKAFRLDPIPPAAYITALGYNYFLAERYEDALALYKRALDRKGEYNPAIIHRGLSAIYAMLGQGDEARHHAAEVLRIRPNYTIKVQARWFQRNYKNPTVADRFIAALRKAGIPENPPLPLPDKPSIAVLPFVNMSEDPKQEYFSDGITEEIITALSKVPQLFVIARNSSFTYKGKPVKVQQVGRELGVKYVLEGSVRKAGDKIRVTAQLVDAKTGHHLWAERYDRDLKDIFAVQDEITMKVITELQVKLTAGDDARILARGTNNLDVYLKYLNAAEILRHLTKEDNLKARKMIKEVIALDPNYPRPYVGLGWTYRADAVFFRSKSPKEDLARAEEYARKALELDESLGLAHSLLASIYRARRQWDRAFAEAERAVSVDPNSQTMYHVANTLKLVGRYEESIAWFEKVLRLEPIPPAFMVETSGQAYFLAGRYEDALTQFKRVLERAKKGEYKLWPAHVALAGTYSVIGQEEEARHHAAEVLRLNPKFSLERFAKRASLTVTANQAGLERVINALRKAGLPE